MINLSMIRLFFHLTQAYHRRFPTCHLIPVFAGSDVINETDDGTVQIVERRCRINVDAPYILRKITGVDHVMFILRNTLDRRKRTLTIEAKNDSFVHHIHIHELCFYKVSFHVWVLHLSDTNTHNHTHISSQSFSLPLLKPFLSRLFEIVVTDNATMTFVIIEK